MDSWHSYPSIYNLGHRAIADLLKGPVIVEEKVDGSQFSFGKFGDRLRARSKGAELDLDSPPKMFKEAVDTVRSLDASLRDGWTYRGEYLQKPRHNGLAYDRIPQHHVIVFDVNTAEETYLNPGDKAAECTRLGLECVPVIFQGMLDDPNMVRGFLTRTSVLGGQLIEGVVIKPADYALFGRDRKCLLGKYVSESFKEVQGKHWKADNPGKADIITLLAAKYGTKARWNKAVLHLREAGQIEDSPKDIGKLMPEVVRDVEKECAEEIRDEFYKWAWPQLRRRITNGLPEWYKEALLQKAFTVAPEAVAVEG